MAQSREELDQALRDILTKAKEETDLDGRVYFQPESNTGLVYPCIVYERARARTEFAGNRPYRYTKRYTVTVIDPDVDSPIPDLVAALPQCTHDRFFVADQLNHDVFDVYT